MPDPITTAIATAVAGSAAQSLTTQASRVLAEITGRIRRKFQEHPADLAILEVARTEPGSHGHAAVLAASLHQAFHDDPAFGRELAILLQQYLNAPDNSVTNTFHGTADKVVQLRDVHGDLNIS